MLDTKIPIEQRNFILDAMAFSYSSVTAYENCPRMFRFTYLDGDKVRQPNAFSDFGSFCHSLLEQYYKGEADLFSLPSLYREGYAENVTSPFPGSRGTTMADNYYRAGEKYFDFFEDPWSNCEVLAVEQKFSRMIGGFPFVGIIDLILRDKESGEIYIVDHKSKSKFKSEKEVKEYLRQLYLYSLYVKDTYGTYPTKLIFNMFKIGEIVERKFEEPGLAYAQAWFQKAVENVYSDDRYIAKEQSRDKNGELVAFDFFCENICSVRNYCPRSSAYREEQYDINE